jgi:hypothetical protein
MEDRNSRVGERRERWETWREVSGSWIRQGNGFPRAFRKKCNLANIWI